MVPGGKPFGIRSEVIWILGGTFKRGDHASRRGVTWTSYAGPDQDSDRDSEVTIDRFLFVDIHDPYREGAVHPYHSTV